MKILNRVETATGALLPPMRGFALNRFLASGEQRQINYYEKAEPMRCTLILHGSGRALHLIRMMQ